MNKYRSLGKRTNRSRIKKVNVLTALIAAFIVANIGVSLHTSSMGADLLELERNSEELLKEISILQQELVDSSSLIAIRESADELEFSQSSTIVYLEIDAPIAASQ